VANRKTSKHPLTSAVRLGMGALLLAGAAAAGAQAYPNRPIRMFVGYAAGGGADALARLTATQIGETLGQSVVVENRPGAGGTVAADALAKAPADGYTLYFADTAVLIAPSVYPSVPYDPLKSFAPVAAVATLPLVVVTNPQVPAKTAAELIALLKANPGKYSYGSPGIGTVHHLAMELFRKQGGFDYVHVPYKGATAFIPDLVSGQLPLGILSAPPALAQVKAGKVKAIAVTSPVKVAGASEWPALADTLPGFDASPALFVVAPAGTPAPVVGKIEASVKTMLAKPAVLEALAGQGATPMHANADELGKFIASEVRKWSAIAKDSGAKAQ
jgi:tripartite-type tricarboxylate transporter receptor subunit TctC